jgi:HNH endonuclease
MFHVEHIVPRQHGGVDDPDNLAPACNHCNLHEGPNLTGLDPESGHIIPLFNPRREAWEDHFLSDGLEIIGRTPTGRVTVRVLGMNTPTRIELRAALRARVS